MATDKTLKEMIEQFNQDPTLIGEIFDFGEQSPLEQLSDDVVLCKCTCGKFQSGPNTHFLDFYFITLNDSRAVGVVYDMNTNIHLYMLENYRKKGLMYNALKSVIISHMKYNHINRGEQDFDFLTTNYDGRGSDGYNLLTSLGFKDINGRLTLPYHKIPDWKKPREQAPDSISDLIDEKINFVRAKLLSIRRDLSPYTIYNSEDYNKIINKLELISFDLTDHHDGLNWCLRIGRYKTKPT